MEYPEYQQPAGPAPSLRSHSLRQDLQLGPRQLRHSQWRSTPLQRQSATCQPRATIAKETTRRRPRARQRRVSAAWHSLPARGRWVLAWPCRVATCTPASSAAMRWKHACTLSPVFALSDRGRNVHNSAARTRSDGRRATWRMPRGAERAILNDARPLCQTRGVPRAAFTRHAARCSGAVLAAALLCFLRMNSCAPVSAAARRPNAGPRGKRTSAHASARGDGA